MYASRKLARVTTEFSKTVWLKDAIISLFLHSLRNELRLGGGHCFSFYRCHHFSLFFLSPRNHLRLGGGHCFSLYELNGGSSLVTGSKTPNCDGLSGRVPSKNRARQRKSSTGQNQVLGTATKCPKHGKKWLAAQSPELHSFKP